MCMADDSKLLEKILDDSNQLIQVSEVGSFSVLYANEPAIRYAGRLGQSYKGVPCYKFFAGLEEPCPGCPALRMGNQECVLKEMELGDRVLSVKTKLMDWNGKKAFIEYVTDISKDREHRKNFLKLQKRDQFRKKLLNSLAGIYFCLYYVDLTTGKFHELGHSGVDAIRTHIGESGDAREKFKVTSEQLVVPEQSEMVAEFTNLDTLADRLANRNSIGIHFNGIYVDWCEGVFVVVDRDSNGRCTNVLWMLRSIKEEVAKENAYKEQLENALQKAERASEAKSGFLARMSHDIRTPLNGILGLLDLSDKKGLPADLQAEYRKKARVAANHLLSLLNDVLEMSKLEDAETQLVEEPFDLRQILTEVFTIANLRAGENGVTISTDKFANMNHFDLLGSPLHIRQVFLNILTNSIKYNKMGGSVYCHSETVQEGPDSVTYRFHVEDTGIGMTQTFLDHIFEPFSQEHDDARSKFQGSGMGMAIVKRLVDKMRGQISVESEVGKGSHFAVTIPFRINHNPKPQEEISVDDLSVEGMKVLLVEDNDLNMEIAQSILEDMGVNVICARNGQEAVRIFEEKSEGYLDLILMDLMMPVLDGFGATKQIRLSGKKDGPQIPIIALSANAFAEDVQKSKQAGMNDHLAKPINISLLKQVLSKYRK